MNSPRDLTEQVQQAKLRYGIVGNSPALTGAVERAVRVAPIDLSVLITGESGTGKEFFPKIIHAYGSRKHAKYIAVNCGAIPEGTIESELFGHEKGSFTGAVATRKGYFEEADGGTIFLDEVAELPLTTQARLLRVLESGEFMKVGSSVVQRTNVRIVAATNVDMQRAVAEGRFREDLFYRLSTVQISVPPLRERGDDLMLLARKFARDFAERYRMPEITFTPEATDLMMRFRWPGNVRQLKNVVEQLGLFEAGTAISRATLASTLAVSPDVTAPVVASHTAPGNHSYEREREMLFNLIFRLQSRIEELSEMVGEHRGDTVTPVAHVSPVTEVARPFPTLPIIHPHPEPDVTEVTPDEVTPASLEQHERQLIIDTLERNSGRRKPAARELGISERTLYRKIKEYGLE